MIKLGRKCDNTKLAIDGKVVFLETDYTAVVKQMEQWVISYHLSGMDFDYSIGW